MSERTKSGLLCLVRQIPSTIPGFVSVLGRPRTGYACPYFISSSDLRRLERRTYAWNNEILFEHMFKHLPQCSGTNREAIIYLTFGLNHRRFMVWAKQRQRANYRRAIFLVSTKTILTGDSCGRWSLSVSTSTDFGWIYFITEPRILENKSGVKRGDYLNHFSGYGASGGWMMELLSVACC